MIQLYGSKINCVFFCVCCARVSERSGVRDSFQDRLSSAPWLTIETRLWKWEMKQPRLTNARWRVKGDLWARDANHTHGRQRFWIRGVITPVNIWHAAILISNPLASFILSQSDAPTTIATAPPKQKQREMGKKFKYTYAKLCGCGGLPAVLWNDMLNRHTFSHSSHRRKKQRQKYMKLLTAMTRGGKWAIIIV